MLRGAGALLAGAMPQPDQAGMQGAASARDMLPRPGVQGRPGSCCGRCAPPASCCRAKPSRSATTGASPSGGRPRGGSATPGLRPGRTAFRARRTGAQGVGTLHAMSLRRRAPPPVPCHALRGTRYAAPVPAETPAATSNAHCATHNSHDAAALLTALWQQQRLH